MAKNTKKSNKAKTPRNWTKPVAAVSTLSDSPLHYMGRIVKAMWVLASSLGYGPNSEVVISPNSVGSLIGPFEGKICVRLFRAQEGRFRLLAVAGLEACGLEKQDKQRPGQYWLPEIFKVEVFVGNPQRGIHARSISTAIPGQTIRISNIKTDKTPAMQKSSRLLSRSVQLRSDGAGTPVIYLGDIGLVGLGRGGWVQYEIVPQDPSGLSQH